MNPVSDTQLAEALEGLLTTMFPVVAVALAVPMVFVGLRAVFRLFFDVIGHVPSVEMSESARNALDAEIARIELSEPEPVKAREPATLTPPARQYTEKRCKCEYCEPKITMLSTPRLDPPKAPGGNMREWHRYWDSFERR